MTDLEDDVVELECNKPETGSDGVELWVGKLGETDGDGGNWGVVTMTEIDDGTQSNNSGDCDGAHCNDSCGVDGAHCNDSCGVDGDGVHCKDGNGKFESCCVALFVVFCAVLQMSVLQLV